MLAAQPLRELQSSSAVLVVPPFECAWLSGDELVLQEGRGCISFESKGELQRVERPTLAQLLLLPPVCG